MVHHSARLGGVGISHRRKSAQTTVLSPIQDVVDTSTDDFEEENNYMMNDLSHLLTKQKESTAANMAPPQPIAVSGEGDCGAPRTPNKQRRSFGEEIDNYNPAATAPVSTTTTAHHEQCVDTSFLSLESKDTAISSITAEETTVASSDCGGTDAGSVAMLRGWLDDFGKQNKKHFDKTAHIGSAPADVNIEKPKRSKVNCPQATPKAPTSVGAASKLLLHTNTKQTPSAVSPCLNVASPVRLKTKKPAEENVQATNDGYASVAKLSAWLANDPTSKKKVKHLRRGANILAKSKVFDKGLEDVIIEQNHIRTGHVTDKKQQIQQSLSRNSSFSIEDVDDLLDGASYCSEDGAKARSTIGLSSSDSSNHIDVNHKKEWLSKAFTSKQNDTSSEEGGSSGNHNTKLPTRAQTDFVTGQDNRDDITSKAKQLWRKRSPCRDSTKAALPEEPEKSADLLALSPTKQKPNNNTELPVQMTPTRTQLYPTVGKDDDNNNKDKESLGDAVNNISPVRKISISVKDSPFRKAELPGPPKAEEEEDSHVDFRKAREMLVKRSKKNGNNVEALSKVNRRKAIFEQMEKDNKRKSLPQGKLKTTWVKAQSQQTQGGPDGELSSSDALALAAESSNNTGANEETGATAVAASTGYKKEYKEDICPKKSFDELP